jgi:hypothetical protein
MNMDPTINKIQQLLYTTQMLAEELEIVYDILDNLFEEEDYDLSETTLLEKKNWIKKAIKKEGSLRKTMKTKKGKNIPVSKLKKAAEKGGKTGKRARLALTLRKLNESGVVTQFNDADDTSPSDERIATRPDGEQELANLEAQLAQMQDQWEEVKDLRMQRTRTGEAASEAMRRIQQQIFDHPITVARRVASLPPPSTFFRSPENPERQEGRRIG